MKYYFAVLLFLLFHLVSCSDDSAGSNNPVLSAPILLEPTNITANSATISWIGDPDAEITRLDLARDTDFTDRVSGYESLTVNGESHTVTGLADGTRYYVRLTARAGEITATSGTRSFTTLQTADPEPGTPLRTLTTLPVGAAVQAGRLNGNYGNLVARQHSSLTAEFEMKMEVNFKGIDNYDFGPGDAIVAFAEANNMQVHGHALIWHLSTPAFLENFSGTDAEFEAVIKKYIQDVVTHYKGKVVSWDVVNEAVNDTSGELRNSVYRQRMGDDFIAKCFQWAAEADPDALLFYNDYSILFDQTKLDASLAIIKSMQDRDIKVNGIGYQSHIDINWPNRSTMAESMQKAVDLGLLVHISELDVKVNPGAAQGLVLTQTLADRQKAKYKEVAEEFLKLPEENRFAITVWGVTDGQSWIPDFLGAPDFPLMFNDDLTAKPAHTGMAEALDSTE